MLPSSLVLVWPTPHMCTSVGSVSFCEYNAIRNIMYQGAPSRYCCLSFCNLYFYNGWSSSGCLLATCPVTLKSTVINNKALIIVPTLHTQTNVTDCEKNSQLVFHSLRISFRHLPGQGEREQINENVFSSVDNEDTVGLFTNLWLACFTYN